MGPDDQTDSQLPQKQGRRWAGKNVTGRLLHQSRSVRKDQISYLGVILFCVKSLEKQKVFLFCFFHFSQISWESGPCLIVECEGDEEM